MSDQENSPKFFLIFERDDFETAPKTEITELRADTFEKALEEAEKTLIYSLSQDFLNELSCPQILTVSKVDDLSDRLHSLETKAKEQREIQRLKDLQQRHQRQEKVEFELFQKLQKKFENKTEV